MVCDGLESLPDSIGKVFGQVKVQTCLTHLLRNSFGYASHNPSPEIAAHRKPIHRPPPAAPPLQVFAAPCGNAYHAMTHTLRHS